jgi:hypothetical protein
MSNMNKVLSQIKLPLKRIKNNNILNQIINDQKD